MEPLPEDKMSNYITGMVNDCYPIVYCWNTLSNINESGVTDHFMSQQTVTQLCYSSHLFCLQDAELLSERKVLQLYSGIAFFSVNKQRRDREGVFIAVILSNL